MNWRRFTPPLGPLIVLGTALFLYRVPSPDGFSVANGSSLDSGSSARPETSTILELPKGLAASNLPALDQRPLFEQGRRQSEQIAVATSENDTTQAPVEPAVTPELIETSAPPIALRLAGIMQSDGQVMALIQIEGSDREDWLRLGDTVGGWTIAAIDASSIRLESGGQEQTVQLYPE